MTRSLGSYQSRLETSFIRKDENSAPVEQGINELRAFFERVEHGPAGRNEG